MRRKSLIWRLTMTVSVLLAVGPGPHPVAQQGSRSRAPEIDRAKLIRQRQEWFYRQRAGLLGHIPPGARLRALEQLDRMLEAEGRLRRAQSSLVAPSVLAPRIASHDLTLLPNQWTLVGPQPTNVPPILSSGGPPQASGRVTALAVDPRNSNVVYLGAAEGGVWRTTDGGTTWTPLTDTQASLAVGSIALDPSNPDTVYVGTGEENFNSPENYYGAGILKSTDGGNSWQLLPNLGGGELTNATFIGSLAVQPTNSQVLLAAIAGFTNTLYGSFGLFRSVDGGMSFSTVFPDTPTVVLFDPSNASTAYTAIGVPGNSGLAGVYKSVDGGQTWTQLTGTGANVLPPSITMGRTALAIAPSSPATLYAGIGTSTHSSPVGASTLLGLYKTVDGGVNWTKLSNTPDYCNPLCWWSNVIAVQPTNPNVVFAGGADLFNFGAKTLIRTLDGGNTWSDVSTTAATNLHADIHALAFSSDGSKLYVGTDGGVWSTTNPTASSISWTDLNATLAITQFYPGISIDPTMATTAFGGTQDNGTQRYSGSLPWEELDPCGDGAWTAIDFTTPSTVYTTCAGGEQALLGDYAIQKSTSGGLGGWTAIQNGIYTNDPINFVPPLVMDQTNPHTLYFGTYRVYQTLDGGNSWTPISPDLTGGLNGTLVAVAVAPSDPKTVYTVADDFNDTVSVTKQANLGAGAVSTWSINSGILPHQPITQISIDPLSASTVYVTLSSFQGGFPGPPTSHVFKSTDSGVAWTNISGNLPDIPANDIVLDPDLPNTIYIATDIGVFATSDGGTTWGPLGTGLPRVAVLSLRLHQPSRTLRAATHGRSVWDLQLGGGSSPAVSLSPSSLGLGSQPVGTASAAQTVTLSNTGNASLAITSIATSGDFSEANNCGSAVAAGKSCTINVTFKPTAAGSRTGTLSINDNAAGGPQAVALSGNGLDFSISAASGASTSATVMPGQTASYKLAFSGSPGFTGRVSLSCTGAPPEATCTPNPTLVALNGTSVADVTVSVTTMAASDAVPLGFSPPGMGIGELNAAPLRWLLVLFVLASLTVVGRRRSTRRGPGLTLLLELLWLAIALPGCGGGGGSGGGSGGGGNPGTPVGTYTISLTGKFSSGSATLTHTMNLKLTVH